MMRRGLPLGLGILFLARTASALDVEVASESTPKPGLRIQKLTITGPKNNAWVAYVDLCGSGIRVDASKASATLRTAGSWGSSAGATLAVNGDFYKTGPLRVYGQAIGGGVKWPVVQTGTDPDYDGEWYWQNYGWIAFGPSWVEVNHTEWVKKNADLYPTRQGYAPRDVTHGVPPGTLALVSGFPELVVEGTQVTCASPTADDCFPDRGDMRDRHPRSAMGLTEDRRTFLLVAVDGRTSASVGLYGAELAELMKKLGAWDAFNLDGGGSTQMWLDGEGYLNDTGGNSGGATRAVANHWGVFTDATSPGHCVDHLVEGLMNVDLGQNGTTDVDGDGSADACIRTAEGVRCALGGANGFTSDVVVAPLGDDAGWSDPTNAGTLRTGDVDGDGKADLCARHDDGMRCWLSDTAPFATEIEGPAWSDEAGWNKPPYHPTVRLADVDGDGRDDLCGRAAKGMVCHLSTGDGFGPALASPVFADEDGYDAIDRAGTLRMGDVDGDRKADVCARGAEGVTCWLSDGAAFSREVAGPAWGDAEGFDAARYWSTIRLVDVDADGKADLCARSANDFRCHLSLGDAFGKAIVLDDLSDEAGYDAPSRYSTIRLGDIDGDRDADLCVRGEASIRCFPWTGAGFGAAIEGPPADDAAWIAPNVYASPRVADVDGDGRDEICLRLAEGLSCASQDGGGFSALGAGPAWGGVGFESDAVYGTLMLEGPRCSARLERCNGIDDDCDGTVDEECVTPGAGGAGGGGSTGSGAGAGGGEDGGGEGGPGCSCSATAHDRALPAGAWGLLATLAWAARRRRRRARTLPCLSRRPRRS